MKTLQVKAIEFHRIRYDPWPPGWRFSTVCEISTLSYSLFFLHSWMEQTDGDSTKAELEMKYYFTHIMNGVRTVNTKHWTKHIIFWSRNETLTRCVSMSRFLCVSHFKLFDAPKYDFASVKNYLIGALERKFSWNSIDNNDIFFSLATWRAHFIYQCLLHYVFAIFYSDQLGLWIYRQYRTWNQNNSMA